MRRRTEIVDSWRACVVAAVRLGDADAAYRLARAFVRRLREIGLVRYDDARALVRMADRGE
jgi:hypothetical protein